VLRLSILVLSFNFLLVLPTLSFFSYSILLRQD